MMWYNWYSTIHTIDIEFCYQAGAYELHLLKKDGKWENLHKSPGGEKNLNMNFVPMYVMGIKLIFKSISPESAYPGHAIKTYETMRNAAGAILTPMEKVLFDGTGFWTFEPVNFIDI